MRRAAICLACAVIACGRDTGDNVAGVGKVGARRLSRVEYDNTLHDLLGDDSHAGFARLPEDVHDPFDNDFATQQPSAVLVEAAETLAGEAADRLLSDPTKRDKVVGCTPTGPDDAACLTAFITHFGRLALRRPLTSDEIAEYAALQSYAVEAGDFYLAVGMVIRTLLQDPEFLYRVEVGTQAAGLPGVFRLNDYELATRLSYFILGTTPDDALLDRAGRHQLSNPKQVRAAAEQLLADPRARDRADRFHALWMGYQTLPHPADVTASMRAETAALVGHVLFDEQRPWTDLFTTDQTYIDATLAGLYGMPAPASGFAWTPFASGPGERRGILSTGSFLSVAGKFGDTSPTQRGKLIRERLLCQTIPPPPPNVNVDMPPPSTGGSSCKYDRYEAHRSVGSCFACHSQMDPVGFGLENFDQMGRYRTTDTGAPECTIAGDGQLIGEDGAITFHGPGELGGVLAQSAQFQGCMVTQLYRFAVGHKEHEEDVPYLESLATALAADGRFDHLVLALVSNDAFAYRREE